MSEQVIIDIVARENALSVLENIRGKLIELSNLSRTLSQTFSKLGSGKKNTVDIDTSKIANFQDKLNQLKKGVDLSNIKKEFDDIEKKVNRVNNTIKGGKRTTKLEEFNDGKSGSKVTDTPKGSSSKLEGFNDGKSGSKIYEPLKTLNPKLEGFNDGKGVSTILEPLKTLNPKLGSFDDGKSGSLILNSPKVTIPKLGSFDDGKSGSKIYEPLKTLNPKLSSFDDGKSISTILEPLKTLNPKLGSFDDGKSGSRITAPPKIVIPKLENFDDKSVPKFIEPIKTTQPKLDDFNGGKSFYGNGKYVPNFRTIGRPYTPKSEDINETVNALERARQVVSSRIKLNIDLKNLKDAKRHINNVKNDIDKLRQNARNSFAGNAKTPSNNLPVASLGTSLVPVNNALTTTNNSLMKVDNSLMVVGKTGQSSANTINKGFSVGRSSFHELNNLLIAVGGQFNNLATSIAGLFGANSLGGMIQKMWEGASQRQTNMLYLMHQRGVQQANEYYDEIMNIVTQLPGDDTFLTNILNMASAMDKSVKLDNLKEMGTAITDYYIASTMKGELPFETQKDMRKYITTGDTKSMRNSLLAGELDMLKDKNSVLERTEALQKALEKTGFAGMSQYESATNALEEFKGHFQKAFADLGTLVILVVQPLLKFYNTIDKIFGSKVSQGIILFAMALVGLFSVIGTGMIITSVFFRNFEMLGQSLNILSIMLKSVSTGQGLLNTVMIEAIGVQEADMIMKNGGILATIRDIKATYQNIIAKELYTYVTAEETISIWGIVTATGSLIKTKILNIASTIKEIIFGVSKNKVSEAELILSMEQMGLDVEELSLREAHNVLTVHSINLKLRENVAKAKDVVITAISSVRNIIHSESNIIDATSEELNTLAKESNTVATISNALAKMRGLINTLRVAGAIILATFIEWTNTESVFANSYAHLNNTAMKLVETEATYGLAFAVGVLEVMLSPLVVTILAIVGVMIALVVVIEKVGEAFGWWKDFGSMFQAIGDGINRIWSAFVNSDVIQGIISYFQKFVASIQYVIESIQGMFSAIFGGANNGTFDIVQSIIDIFGRLGDAIMWVWNLMDDWSNSPLGIITWLNPLGILLFHLDEIGSFFEDIGDAINEFTSSTEFQDMMSAIGEAWEELQEPFQEIWNLLNEIMGLFGEAFQDPEGQGTEERINFLVEILKGLATVIRVVVVPAIRAIAFAINVVLTPIRILLFVIKSIGNAIRQVTQGLDLFRVAWEVLVSPIRIIGLMVDAVTKGIGQLVDGIKNSFIGKIFGWDKEDKNKPNLTNGGNLTNNVNDVRNLGRAYNSTNNTRQTVIHQHFSEGSMPIDARNMTKKEARKMFIGAFGYNRSVGSKGILR